MKGFDRFVKKVNENPWRMIGYTCFVIIGLLCIMLANLMNDWVSTAIYYVGGVVIMLLAGIDLTLMEIKDILSKE